LSWATTGGLDALERRLMGEPGARDELVAGLSALLAASHIRRRIAAQLSESFLRWLGEAFASSGPAEPGRAQATRGAASSQYGRQIARRGSAAWLEWLRAGGSETEVAGEADALRPGTETSARRGASAEPLFVSCAGIVLVGTFLSRLFERVGLLSGDAFVDHGASARAVHLCAALVDAAWQPREPDLVVSKLLCGIPLEQPIPRVELDDLERAECRRLLEAAIAHWARLGSTSPETFAETFLRRDGRLDRREDGWHLTVEQAAVDILLDSVPWSIHRVQLPWMPWPLRVAWC
jgi:hypothetical protein